MYEVRVKFSTAYQSYTFKCKILVKEGDQVLCDTSRGIQIGTVSDVKTGSNDKDLSLVAKKWIFQKLDLTALEVLLKEDAEKAYRENRIKEVTEKLKKRVAEYSYLELYEAVAEANPRAKELLAELKELQNS